MKLLAALTPVEFRRMRKLFQSPIYTSDPHHLILYDYIRKYYPTFDSPHLEKEKLFAKVFQGQSFNNLKLRMLTSQFTRLTEDYILLLEQRENAFDRQKRLVRCYGKRNLYDSFEKETKRLLSNLEKSPYRNMEYYLHLVQLNEAWYFHPMKPKYDLEDTALVDLLDSLDKYFVLGKMRFWIAMKNIEKITSKKYDMRFFEAIKFELESGFIAKNNLHNLYLHSIKLIETQEETNLETIEKKLFKNWDNLALKDKQILFFNCWNYIIQQLNSGKEGFGKKLFEWNKIGIKEQLFLENNQMDDVIFSNIVIQGCKEGAFTWTRTFIDNHKSYLRLEKQENVVRFNLGICHYYQGDFNQALNILMNFPFMPSYILRSRLIIIEALFELFLTDNNYYEVLISNIQSFEIYIFKNKFYATSKLQPHLNFIRTLKKLANKIFNHESKSAITYWLESHLGKVEAISRKKWLKLKVETL